MKSKKGFTLIELLAVVVILGILMTISIPAVTKWIDQGKKANIESQKQSLLMASKTYAQTNRNVLPKAIGESTEISAQELKSANYLDKDIINGDKKSCMADSKVVIYKYSKTGYSYTAYIYCEGEEVPTIVTAPKPSITVQFTDINGSTNFTQNVAIAAVKITINGGTSNGKNLGITSYRYTISVNYTLASDQKVEIFNTEFIEAGGKEQIVIQKKLTDYVDITKATNFNVQAEAYNEEGGYIKVNENSSFKDTTPPSCGRITGQAGENSWKTNVGATRKISVECDDGDGSGCVKDVFTKTFKTQLNTSTITIRDNAGNERECTVRVHIDWTSPKVIINAYKRKAGGGKLDNTVIGTVTADPADNSKTVVLKKYTNGIGDDSWLNAANYPDGIYLEVTTSDNIKLASGVYSENAKMLKKNASNVETLSPLINNSGGGQTFELYEEGYRRGNYVVKDAGGNTATIKIIAPIDRTIPECGNLTGQPGEDEWDRTWREKTISVACSDKVSNCTKTSYSKTFKDQAENGTIAIVDNANNGTTCGTRVHLDWTTPKVVVKAYKLTNDSGAHESSTVQTLTVDAKSDGNHASGTMNSYANGNGTDSWLNASNYPYGIYYEVTTSDNIKLKSEVYKLNASGLTKTEADDTTNHPLTKQFENAGTGSNFMIKEEGYRKATYVVQDAAGNKNTITIIAPMDRTAPVISKSTSNNGSESGVSVSISCTDAISGCSGKTDTITKTSEYTINDAAGNTSNKVKVSISSYDCNPYTDDCNPHDCNCEECNCKNCNCTPCNCTECCHYWYYDKGCPCNTCIEPCGQTCGTCCQKCCDSCCDTCYDTCTFYKTCYKEV